MSKLIAINKFAKSDYEIKDSWECGISLLGWEVKSLRAKNVKMETAFCSISNKLEMWLNNLNIAQYMLVKCDPYRSRKLLLHKKEILAIKNKAERLNMIILPLKIYWEGNHIKVEIALAKRLKKFDKRQKIIQEEQNKNIAKSLKY
ncbi:SsrA-binding protein SmpB [[Mycoplasma] falconis]|uniref:SsrA-binding protein n=1 Tax=[Mycoplasma] falconis TaxID=92403 RepID=A0A501XAP0_9BACT|nr:SsrA-binding protein SmpB [[Mycoplasma] falconis]TPE57423.1 SsrA-binding protein SmpB [[Mycoplasma] falconis]